LSRAARQEAYRSPGRQGIVTQEKPPLLDRFMDRVFEGATSGRLTARRALAAIIILTTAVTVLAGLIMRLFDHSAYSTFGSGMWWAVQTVTTVGYGDNLPDNRLGYVVASILMLTGIAFLTVATATITAMLVEARHRKEPHDLESPVAREIELLRAELEELRRDLQARG
jgi:voltage-gated potassium channel